VIEQAGVPALRIALTISVIILLFGGITIFRRQHQFSIAIQTPKMMDRPSDTIVWRKSCLFGTV
jgi:hypothetical protein